MRTRASAGIPSARSSAWLRFRTCLFGAAVALATLTLLPSSAHTSGHGAILTPAGFNAHVVPRGDDTSNLVVGMPFTMNWNGVNFTQIFINMNGNVTFGAGYTVWDPAITLAATNANIMAPFWADVDTSNAAAAQVTYSSTTPGSIPQVNGRNAFIVNWIGVARFSQQATPTNSFQLVIVDRSDTGAGNFDFMFNYDQITWDIGTGSSTRRARVGWAQAGTGFELPGSGTAQGSPSTLIDTAPSATSLIQNSLNSGGQLGRYVWQVRAGTAPNLPPELDVVDRVLEGNAPNSFTGYTGAGDATATDADGTIANLTHNRPATLPLGTTTVLWTATDNRGAVTTASQSILVTDTTPPTNPPLSSPTHSTGVWSSNPTVTVSATPGVPDVCSGVAGLSYEWRRNSPAAPDRVVDPSTATTVTVPTPVVVDHQTFPNAAWPTDWIRSSTSWVRLTNAAGRTQGTHAAEIWTDSNTRRTVSFFRDYTLTGFTSAELSFWDQVSALGTAGGGTDAVTVEFSTNAGATWTALRTTSGASAAQAWTRRSYSLPVGGTVRVRFSASVNRSAEFANWDDITVTGVTMAPTPVRTMSATNALADGTWHFSLASVDGAGNWSAPVSLGPILIDTVPPVTTDNAPTGWSRTPVAVTLTPTDAGVIAATHFSLNGSALATYTAPVAVSTEGTSTLRYWSRDVAGHVEATRTATIRVDTQPPTVPTTLTAGAISTTSIELLWGSSTDTVSGVARYAIHRDGALVATTTATTYIDTGLVPGATHEYRVSALDVAGNESLRSGSASETVPGAAIWLSLSPTTVDMGSVDPGDSSTATTATVVTVGGVGTISYDLLTSASDFSNASPGGPSLPASSLSLAGRGFAVVAAQPFSTIPVRLNTATGSRYRWSHTYVFDFTLAVPWTFEAGDYTSTIRYTVVVN